MPPAARPVASISRAVAAARADGPQVGHLRPHPGHARHRSACGQDGPGPRSRCHRARPVLIVPRSDTPTERRPTSADQTQRLPGQFSPPQRGLAGPGSPAVDTPRPIVPCARAFGPCARGPRWCSDGLEGPMRSWHVGKQRDHMSRRDTHVDAMVRHLGSQPPGTATKPPDIRCPPGPPLPCQPGPSGQAASMNRRGGGRAPDAKRRQVRIW